MLKFTTMEIVRNLFAAFLLFLALLFATICPMKKSIVIENSIRNTYFGSPHA